MAFQPFLKDFLVFAGLSGLLRLCRKEAVRISLGGTTLRVFRESLFACVTVTASSEPLFVPRMSEKDGCLHFCFYRNCSRAQVLPFLEAGEDVGMH